MFLPASSSLPLIPPPFTSILSTHYSSGPTNSHDQFSTTQSSPRRSNQHQPHPSSLRNPNSLRSLLLDEAAITSRKAAISTYGYSWLRPAGVAKTMLGRREEEAEREELERQMREQEEMELEMERGEELARQTRLREQQQQGRGAGGEEVEQRDLDEMIPDADVARQQQQGRGDADLDDDIPDADAENTFDSEDDNDEIEGEPGMTDEVEHTNLSDDDPTAHLAPVTARIVPPRNRPAQNPNTTQLHGQEALAAHQAFLVRRSQEQAEQEALANAMLDEDEQAFADRDLDAEIPSNEDENGLEVRDLDDDVPEADDDNGAEGEGEWQHTDTELEEDESGLMLMEDEGGDISMDMSVIQGRRSISGNAAAGAAVQLATPAGAGSSMLHTPATGARNWLSRRSLSGRGTTGNLFAGLMGRGSAAGSGAGTTAAAGSPFTPTLIQPSDEAVQGREEPQQPQQQPRRRSRRSGFGREHRSARESLD